MDGTESGAGKVEFSSGADALEGNFFRGGHGGLRGSVLLVTVQSCIKTVVFVIARSVLCDEAIPKRSIWSDKWEIASPENGSQ